MAKKRILVLDTYYQPVFKTLKVDQDKDYQTNLETLLRFGFGTGDSYSFNLKKFGWETRDVIANHQELQSKWQQENNINNIQNTIAFYQVIDFRPDVLFCQDLSFFREDQLSYFKKIGIYLAGQCSCPFPPIENVREFQMLFTSFPHYIERFEKLGVKAYYNPLAFDPRILSRLSKKEDRDIPILFIGGVGTPAHWDYGMKILAAIARTFPESQFYGYGYETLPETNPIKKRWRGEAWGLDYFNLLARAEIVINRHGEVAEGYSNNMRLFEGTGCGALLFTEKSKNLDNFFTHNYEIVAYESEQDLIERLSFHLQEGKEFTQEKAYRGQIRTLSEHTYMNRMALISEKLNEVIA